MALALPAHGEGFLSSHSQPASLQAVAPGSHSLAITLGNDFGVGGWRLRGESAWRSSGETVDYLLEGDQWVEFKPVTGRKTPTGQEIPVAGSIQVSVDYVSRPIAVGTGWLSVSVDPQPEASFWRVQGEIDWRSAGERVILEGGVVPVEFRDVPGWWAPGPALARVVPGQGTRLRRAYERAADPAEWGMSPISSIDLDDAPYRYIGRIDSPRGSFTGIVVDQYVVLTTRDAVLDPVSGRLVPGVTWSPISHDGERVPAPRKAAGIILMTDPEAADLADPANALVAIYFRKPAADGGWSGFHQGPEWLSAGTLARAVGYLPGDGRIQTSTVRPMPETSITGGLFELAGFHGKAGIPLLTRRSNGRYYPAALSIGEFGSVGSVMRLIDADVGRMIRAANDRALLDGGGTGTDVDLTRGLFGGGTRAPGRVTTLIEGSENGRWKVADADFVPSDESIEVEPGSHDVLFAQAAGMISPPEHPVEVQAGEEAILEVVYGQTYESFAAEVFPGGGPDTGPSDDHDRDGMNNLLEWAFGRDPTVREAAGDNRSPLTQVRQESGDEASPRLRVRYYRRKAAVAAGAVYEVQFGDGLNDWRTHPVEHCEDLGSEWERVTVDDPEMGSSRRFGRLSVESTNP